MILVSCESFPLVVAGLNPVFTGNDEERLDSALRTSSVANSKTTTRSKVNAMNFIYIGWVGEQNQNAINV